MLRSDEDEDDGPEKTYKLTCGHLYPYRLYYKIVLCCLMQYADQFEASTYPPAQPLGY